MIGVPMRLIHILEARLDFEAQREKAAAEQERLRQQRDRKRADQREAAEKQTTDLAKRREQIRERALRQGEKTRKHCERDQRQDRRRYTDWLDELGDILGLAVYDPEFDAAACASDQAPTYPAGQAPEGPSLGLDAPQTPRNIPRPPRGQGKARKGPRDPSGKRAGPA